MAQKRGSFGFEVSAEGAVENTAANVAALRKLWLDRTMIKGADLGPGNPGDFDNGAWHSACHLAAAAGVRRAADNSITWLELSYQSSNDEYYATLTIRDGQSAKTLALGSSQAQSLLNGSSLLGFVEGNSVGHISARGAQDTPARFNRWLRQDFDQPTTSRSDGGKVWEHWCTVRNIREAQPLPTSVLTGYIALLAACGDQFLPTVARGRRDYGHPTQLCAMVRAGLTSEAAATWDTRPLPIPEAVERPLLEARPADELAAAEQLTWGPEPRYYMFERRISHWSPAAAVRRDLDRFGS